VYVYRIKEELAGILAQLSFSENPRYFTGFLGIVSVGGAGNDDLAYAGTAKIITELLADEFNFGEYYFNSVLAAREKDEGRKLNEAELKDLRAQVPKTYREFYRELSPPKTVPIFMNFSETLNDGEVKKAAQKLYQELFGNLPSPELIRIPDEVIQRHRKDYSDSDVDKAQTTNVERNGNAGGGLATRTREESAHLTEQLGTQSEQSNHPGRQGFDNAMKENVKGGIDFNPEKIAFKTQNIGEAINFTIDPAMLQRMQNASGVTPVIISVQPLDNFSKFLGVAPITGDVKPAAL
jgi:hypothetical protein